MKLKCTFYGRMSTLGSVQRAVLARMSKELINFKAECAYCIPISLWVATVRFGLHP